MELGVLATQVLGGTPLEGWDEARAKSVRADVAVLFESMKDPNVCLQIVTAARAGKYGENSALIAEQAALELPLAQARADSVARAVADVDIETKERLVSVQNKLTEAAGKYKALTQHEKGKESN